MGDAEGISWWMRGVAFVQDNSSARTVRLLNFCIVFAKLARMLRNWHGPSVDPGAMGRPPVGLPRPTAAEPRWPGLAAFDLPSSSNWPAAGWPCSHRYPRGGGGDHRHGERCRESTRVRRTSRRAAPRVSPAGAGAQHGRPTSQAARSARVRGRPSVTGRPRSTRLVRPWPVMAAGHECRRKMRQGFRVEVDRQAVAGLTQFSQPHADGRDLVLAPGCRRAGAASSLRPRHPTPTAAGPQLARDVEPGQRWRSTQSSRHTPRSRSAGCQRPAGSESKHHIDHPLAPRTVIGELARPGAPGAPRNGAGSVRSAALARFRRCRAAEAPAARSPRRRGPF